MNWLKQSATSGEENGEGRGEEKREEQGIREEGRKGERRRREKKVGESKGGERRLGEKRREGKGNEGERRGEEKRETGMFSREHGDMETSPLPCFSFPSAPIPWALPQHGNA